MTAALGAFGIFGMFKTPRMFGSYGHERYSLSKACSKYKVGCLKLQEEVQLAKLVIQDHTGTDMHILGLHGKAEMALDWLLLQD